MIKNSVVLYVIKNAKKGGGWVSINLFYTRQTKLAGVLISVLNPKGNPD